jgi:hypothetical protein
VLASQSVNHKIIKEINMDEFRTIAKLWPSGAELNLETDSNLLGGPATFMRRAVNWVTDGEHNYQFLFWNTGRRLTNKRSVRWNFSVLGWGTWTATRWYGTPPSGGPGAQRVHADAFLIGGDAPLSATPIDAAASTFAPGAYPFNGNDHEIGTAGGAVTVAAVDPYQSYDFAGWLQLIWGGDDSDVFIETDSGSGGTIGGSGFYDHLPGVTYHAARGSGPDVLASYGYHHNARPGNIAIGDLGQLVDIVVGGAVVPPISLAADPSPIDVIRLKMIEQLLLQMRLSPSGGSGLKNLIEAAPGMSADQLKQAVKSVKVNINLGKTALTALDAQLKAKTK